MRSRLIFALAVPFLSGCISLIPDAGELPPRIALAVPLENGDAQAPRFDATLIVADPEAASVFNTSKVAVATAPYAFAYLEDAEWTDRAPILWRRYLQQRLEGENLFVAVSDLAQMPLADYLLYTDIRGFHIDRTEATPRVRITVNARLAAARGVTLGTRTIRTTVPLQGSGQGPTALALNNAASSATDELAAWVEELVAAREASSEVADD